MARRVPPPLHLHLRSVAADVRLSRSFRLCPDDVCVLAQGHHPVCRIRAGRGLLAQPVRLPDHARPHGRAGFITIYSFSK